MKILFYSILAIIVFLFISETKIKFNPFSISVNSWLLGFAWLFLTLSIGFFGAHYYGKGKKEGIQKAIDLIQEVTNEETKTKEMQGNA